ncbi:triosephosphate isomerase [Penaeus vannamei]|uniref:Triosephosphate isomerase n=1 Tax=Penaeus vannamei TaxID=6689 RepID=A0A423TYF5_PENVA|nr:triosephosphate isomerase-like [Penaeus vannamei]ROT81496.1 triosephosphate isomerase [Penaeus vannamei]
MASARRFVVVGNWDASVRDNDVERLANTLRTGPLNPNTEVVIGCPTWSYNIAKQHLPREVGIATQGSYKTEIVLNKRTSLEMTSNYGHDWVLLNDFESNDNLDENVRRALEADLKIIACVCETTDDRKNGRTREVLFRQLESLASAISDWSRVVVAFEALWASNTGVIATNQQVQEALALVRDWLRNNLGDNVADTTRIIYSGSVFPYNCHALAKLKDLDGFLVGSDALNFDFLQIVNASRSSHTALLMKQQQLKVTSHLIQGLREEYFHHKSLQRKRFPKRYI